jgi:hypothetical protein
MGSSALMICYRHAHKIIRKSLHDVIINKWICDYITFPIKGMDIMIYQNYMLEKN